MTHAMEAAPGTTERYAFGKNWQRLLSKITPERIAIAEASLQRMLGVSSLAGHSFLDIGSGSGLFSLAAARMGARVVSFDFDADSVGCTDEVRRRYLPHADWTVQQGSVLNAVFLQSLGTFDVVYSWGVLHHTGEMWNAIKNASTRVAPGGQLFIAIYNDQHGTSRRWLTVKKLYNRMPGKAGKFIFLLAVALPWDARDAAKRLLMGRNPFQLSVGQNMRERGTSMWYTGWEDWVGGLPFEVATVDAIFNFLAPKGFTLEQIVTRAGMGCNEFVFRRA